MFLKVVRFLWILWARPVSEPGTATHIDLTTHKTTVDQLTKRATNAETENRLNSDENRRLKEHVSNLQSLLTDVESQLKHQVELTATWRARAAAVEGQIRQRDKEELVPLGRNSTHHWIRQVHLDGNEPYAALVAEARVKAEEFSPRARVGKIERNALGWWTAQIQVPIEEWEIAQFTPNPWSAR